jgi:hypothetical protein
MPGFFAALRMTTGRGLRMTGGPALLGRISGR